MADNDLFKKGLDELKTLRAEIEKGLKTAGEEARESWQKLQPHLQQAEKVASAKASEVAQEVGESAGAMIEDLRGKLEDLRKRVRKQDS